MIAMGEELSLAGVKVDEIKPKTPAAPKPTVPQPVLLSQKVNGTPLKPSVAKGATKWAGRVEADVTEDPLMNKGTRRLHQPGDSSNASSRLLRRSKSLGVKVRKTSTAPNQERLSHSLRDRASLNHISLSKQSTPKKKNDQRTELPSLELEKSQRRSKEESKNLEIEKMALKCQQRREIYALNREMRKLENESFHAFMARCDNDIRLQISTGSCKPLDNMLLSGARV